MAVAIDDFAKYVRPQVLGVPDPLLQDVILRTCVDFCERTELLAEIVSLTLVNADDTYPVLSVDNMLYPARVRQVLYDEVPLDKTTREQWMLSGDRYRSGPPENYFSPTHNQITFGPVPNGTMTAELDVVMRPDYTATTVPDVLFDEWVHAIAAGAKAELLVMDGMPWANPVLGGYYKGVYDAHVATAGVQTAQGNVGAAMHVTPMML